MKSLVVVAVLSATSPARVEAQPPAYAAELAGAGLRFCADDQGGRLEDVPISSVVEFADVVASQTDLETGLVVMSIAARESRFHWDVMSGVRRGDDGAACGAMQIHNAVQKRPGDPTTCADATRWPDVYVAMGLRWLRDTPTAWGNIAIHRARARRWLQLTHEHIVKIDRR